MKNEEVLKQAIEKALNNGWKKKNITFNPKVGAYEMIFSHDFAKAFWGEEEICPDCGKKEECYCTNLDLYMFPRKEKEWEFHLQVMVLEKDPIQYLKKFI